MADEKVQLKIVIVEDDKFLQKILTTKFAKEGFDVRTATDGEAALALVNEALPDMILTDLILPKMSGFEVLTELKTNPKTKNVPAIVLTNLGQEEDKLRAKSLGAVEFMVKADFSINEVVAKVKEIYAKHLHASG